MINESENSPVSSSVNDENQFNENSFNNEKRRVTLIDDFADENSSETNVEETPKADLTPQQISEFFAATEEGSVEKLEELFDRIENVDPNMTRYTESLLMAAIRCKRPNVAEFLIDQMAVNVNHNSSLLEFRPQTRMPIRQRPLTCRELAYDRGLMDLVDLIDLTSDETRPSVKRFLHRRLKNRIDEIHQSYVKRFREQNAEFLVAKESNDQLIVEEESEIRQKDDSFQNLSSIEKSNESNEQCDGPVPLSRVFRSKICETVQKIDFSAEKSIDESKRKDFRYSGYKLRFRLDENSPKQKKIPTKPTSPFALLQEPSSPRQTNFNSSSLIGTRPRTTVRTGTARSQWSNFEGNLSLPIRENRTSICRSARRVPTARVTTENKEKPIRPPSHRLLPKRPKTVRPNFSFIPVNEQTMVYNQTTRFVPLTLKSTAAGLTSERGLVRD